MSQMDFRTAVCQALDEELEHDDSVIFFGEDVAVAGGVFATTGGLRRQARHRPRLRHADLGARAGRRGVRQRRSPACAR